MLRTYASLIVVYAALLTGGVASAQQVVTKTAESFEAGGWEASQWNRAAGDLTLVSDEAPGSPGNKSMQVEVRFPASFGAFTAVPAGGGITIPGDVKSITVSHKVSDDRFPIKFSFMDGWGRTKVDGKSLEWSPRRKGTGWETSTFEVPADWVRPITLTGVYTHNWADRQHENTVRLWVDHIEVTTDISGVDPATGLLRGWKPQPNPADPDKALGAPPATPLVDVAFSTGVDGNVFQDDQPRVVVSVRNWKPGALQGKLTTRVFDNAGEVVETREEAVSVASVASLSVPLKAPRYGRYRLEAELAMQGEQPLRSEMYFAKISPRRALTDQEKLASPYGINVHSGAPWPIDPFVKAGMVWFREYAFGWAWLDRARNGGDYGGWPYFPSIVQTFDDAGVHVMPVLQKSIVKPVVEDGKVVPESIGPDAQWRRRLADIILAFPTVTHWELSNEYDLPEANRAAEDLCDWANYGEYHRVFGEVVDVIGGGRLTAVENGRAGIWPDMVRSQIERGYFDHIGVVNSHHYCGTDAPEVNYGNFNTGFTKGDGRPGLLFDRLRATSRAADADGKDRDHYVTEFGWDTLAGHVVTPYQQAVYLQRAWMGMMAAGVDKGFWFYDNDSPNPSHFFDGCGLFDADWQPKLSLVALAGMTARLPAPTYVGSLRAGDNAMGYVFEQDGKLVAALWTIEGDAGPEVTFDAQRLYDYLGNPIEGETVRLTAAPVYAVGLKRGSRLHRQTAYSLDSNYLEIAAAGDPVEPILRIENNRDSAIDATVTLELPEGWTADKTQASVSVAPGKHELVTLPFTVDPDEPLGMKVATFTLREGGGEEVVKKIPLRLMVQPPLAMQVSALSGRPGDAQITVKIANRSDRARGGRLELALPASWHADQPSRKVENIQPGEVREVPVSLTWTGEWEPGETAMVKFHSGEGKPLTQPLIPSAYSLHRAVDITLDGQISEWSEQTRLPTWMLGSTMGEPNARIHLAWAPEGIYGAFEVHDSRVLATDPRSFWYGDVLELWIDTADDKQSHSFTTGDHQFWLVPQVEQDRVYVGQWKRGDTIDATRYDLPGIQSAARRIEDGYVMEFLLPAAELKGYDPAPGERLGLNVNLTVKGERYDREVYWSRSKASDIADPAGWGSVELVE